MDATTARIRSAQVSDLLPNPSHSSGYTKDRQDTAGLGLERWLQEGKGSRRAVNVVRCVLVALTECTILCDLDTF